MNGLYFLRRLDATFLTRKLIKPNPLSASSFLGLVSISCFNSWMASSRIFWVLASKKRRSTIYFIRTFFQKKASCKL